MKSILQTEKRCYLTGNTQGLHQHHIFGGANRRNSTKYGLTIWLIPKLHNMSTEAIHYNKQLDISVKKTGQMAFEARHGTRADFMRIFGKNYLD